MNITFTPFSSEVVRRPPWVDLQRRFDSMSSIQTLLYSSFRNGSSSVDMICYCTRALKVLPVQYPKTRLEIPCLWISTRKSLVGAYGSKSWNTDVQLYPLNSHPDSWQGLNPMTPSGLWTPPRTETLMMRLGTQLICIASQGWFTWPRNCASSIDSSLQQARFRKDRVTGKCMRKQHTVRGIVILW